MCLGLQASVGGGRECVLVYIRECRLSLASSERTAVSGFTKARKSCFWVYKIETKGQEVTTFIILFCKKKIKRVCLGLQNKKGDRKNKESKQRIQTMG